MLTAGLLTLGQAWACADDCEVKSGSYFQFEETSASFWRGFGYTDIAKLLGVDRRYLVAKLSKKPDFPKPLLKISRRTVWWSEKDIWDWASRKARQG